MLYPAGMNSEESIYLFNLFSCSRILVVVTIIYVENFKLKVCTCAQRMARTKFLLDIIISTIFAIHKLRGNILESSRNVHETIPRESRLSTIYRAVNINNTSINALAHI